MIAVGDAVLAGTVYALHSMTGRVVSVDGDQAEVLWSDGVKLRYGINQVASGRMENRWKTALLEDCQ